MQFNIYKNSLVESINGNLKEAQRSFSSAAIHDLRVAIKRLRSLFYILTEIDGSFKKKELERIVRRLFKAAGRVRDLQVAEKIVRDCAGNTSMEVSEYYNYLKDKESTARQRFLAIAKNFSKKSLTHLSGRITNGFNGIPPNHLERAIGRNAAAALLRVASRKNLKPLPFEELHELRIVAKDARYRIQVLSMIKQEKELLKDADIWLRSMHQMIGRWHDLVVAGNNLNEFLLKGAISPVYSPDSYLALSNEFEKRADEAYRQFAEIWSDKQGVLKKSIGLLQDYNI